VGERANALAERFEQANADAIAIVGRLSDADWRQITDEGWTVAAAAHHIASVHPGIAAFVRAAGNGNARQRPDMGAVGESNARRAREYAACSRSEVIDELRAQGAAAAAIVRGLGDEQLDRTTDAIPGRAAVSAAQLIEMALIGHVREHLASITRAVGV
jgi:hypothetical protein